MEQRAIESDSASVIATLCDLFKRVLKAVYPDAWRLRPYVINHIVGHIPFNAVRLALMERAGIGFGDRRTNAIMMGTRFYGVKNVAIGRHSIIGRDCRFDAGGTISIGESTDIAHGVRLQTGSHNIHSTDFEAIYKPIVVGDNVWICETAMVIGGVTIGSGAVVTAGAVVTQDVEPWTIVGGVPARPIGVRPPVSYRLDWSADFN